MIPLAALTFLAGAITYRWRTMPADHFPPFLQPRWTRRTLFAAVLALAAATAPLPWPYFLAIPLAALPGTLIGHRSYFPGGGVRLDNEPFSFMTCWIYLESPPSLIGEAGKALGMTLTGLTLTVPIALVLFLADASWWYAGVGLLKAVAYQIPYRMGMRNKTEVAEFLWGGLAAGLLAVG
jgi:hypothetical protein